MSKRQPHRLAGAAVAGSGLRPRPAELVQSIKFLFLVMNLPELAEGEGKKAYLIRGRQ